jgi:hypothetical protein
MAKRRRTTGSKIDVTIEGADVRGVVGAQHVVIENQNFFSTPVAHPGDDACSVSPSDGAETFPVWHVPYPRNPHFTGRLEVVARLEAELQSGQAAAVTQAIAGLGGIGKTQLALEYCYRQASCYKVVWWIRAESKATRVADFAALAKRLRLGLVDESNLDNSVPVIVDWLNRTPGWLLVFDNVEHPEDLEHLAPVAGRGHILITSRHATWGTLAKTVSLNVWTPEESTQYLLKRTGVDDTETNKRAATALAEALGYLPLAIEQAAAYIDESKITISMYTELFAQHQLRLFEGRAAQPMSAQRTIATVWDISLRSIERESPGAVALLKLCAFMRPDRISKQHIENYHYILLEPLRTTVSNKLALHDAIATLRRYSLVDATPEFISVHRLVQLVVRDRLDRQDSRSFRKIAYFLDVEGSRFGNLTVAVLVGVSFYRDTRVRPLAACAPETERLARALIDPVGCGLPDRNVDVLTNERATRQPVIDLLKERTSAATRDQIFLFYFAGHSDALEHGFALLTHDSVFGDLAATAITSDDLDEIFAACNARGVLIILDCSGGAALAENAPSFVRKLGPDEDFRILLSASRANQSSWETAQGSLFTKHLLALVDGTEQGSAKPGAVYFSDLLKHLHHVNAEEIANANGRIPAPEPVFIGGYTNDPLVFLHSGKTLKQRVQRYARAYVLHKIRLTVAVMLGVFAITLAAFWMYFMVNSG